MNKVSINSISVLSVALAPAAASAQITETPYAGPLQDLMVNILVFVNNVLIPFIIGIGFLVFVWGMFKYFILGGADEEKKEQGKSLVIYATLGFVIIIIFFGIVNLITSSIGLGGVELENIPYAPVP